MVYQVTMNKEDLVNMIAAKTRLTKKETIHILDSLTETIMETVASGDKVVLVGFGTFGAIC
ncbi:HU family DNA-binding protein [Crocosphaera watsonii WH 8501]|nr:MULTISPECIES: HU family DNA-binding protein [Crocosphaera]